MTLNQRSRLTIDLGGPWQLYTQTLPPHSRALGTITRVFGDTGALVHMERFDRYVQVNAGAVRTLQQAQVVAAVNAARAGTQGGPGRGQGVKAADGATGLKRVNVTLDAASIARAKFIGDGQVSLGVRRALTAHHKTQPD